MAWRFDDHRQEVPRAAILDGEFMVAAIDEANACAQTDEAVFAHDLDFPRLLAQALEAQAVAVDDQITRDLVGLAEHVEHAAARGAHGHVVGTRAIQATETRDCRARHARARLDQRQVPGPAGHAFAEDPQKHDAAHGQRRPQRQVHERAQRLARALRQIKIQRPRQARIQQEQQRGHHDRPACALVGIEHATHVLQARVIERGLPVRQRYDARSLPGMAQQIHHLQARPRIPHGQFGVGVEGQDVHFAEPVTGGLAPGSGPQVGAGQPEERRDELGGGLGRLHRDARRRVAEAPFAGRVDRNCELRQDTELARRGAALHVPARKRLEPRAVQILRPIEHDRQCTAAQHPREQGVGRDRRERGQETARRQHQGRACVARCQIGQHQFAGGRVHYRCADGHRRGSQRITGNALVHGHGLRVQRRRDAAGHAQVEQQGIEATQGRELLGRQLVALTVHGHDFGLARARDQAVAGQEQIDATLGSDRKRRAR